MPAIRSHSDQPATPETPPRFVWVDTAKGIAIIFVVMFHAVTFLRDIGLEGPWVSVSGPLESFRMPLFFFAAGLFAQRALSMRFTDLLRHRVARLVWLYLLWTTIYAVALVFIPVQRDIPDSNPVIRWLISLIVPNESTWFVYALALYLCLAWVLRALPVIAQLGLAAIPSVASAVGWLPASTEAAGKTATYFFFFLLAVHFAQFSFRWVARSGWIYVAGSAVLYAGLVWGTRRLEIDDFPGVNTISGIAAVIFGVTLSSALSRLRLFGWVTFLGRHTLAIYFVHFYVVLGCVAVLAVVPTESIPASVWVPVVTTIGVIIPLAIERIAAPLTWLWSEPRWLTGRRSRV